MSKTASPEQLLIVALQEIHDAERAWGERGAELRHGAGEKVRSFLVKDGQRSARQVKVLAELLDVLGERTSGTLQSIVRWVFQISSRRDRKGTIEPPGLNAPFAARFVQCDLMAVDQRIAKRNAYRDHSPGWFDAT